jgi:hypothetical protein
LLCHLLLVSGEFGALMPYHRQRHCPGAGG